MGWRGSAVHWTRYETASLLLAGLATPLVVSVHTVVSFDFAVAIVPGWHTTIFPPYFVAGAIYSGFAMVMTLAIPIRKFYHLEDMVTMRHLDNMAKVMLATGMIVAYGYMMETFMAFYSGNQFDRYMIMNRMTGPYACDLLVADRVQHRNSASDVVARKCARACRCCLSISLIVNMGMWLERFVIVVISLHPRLRALDRGACTIPTKWDWATYIGTIGLFFTLFFLFVRFLPMISIVEMRSLVRGNRRRKPEQIGRD